MPTFRNTLDSDYITPRDDMPTASPDRRHVEITNPARGSHRKEGPIYLQRSIESKPD